MEQMVFLIKGMDCPDEVAILKKTVGPLVGGETNLAFDILNGRMTITSGDAVGQEEIVQAVSRTGMQAIPWDQFCVGGVCAVEENFWQQHGRWLMCAISGVLAAAGLVLTVLHHGGIWEAITPSHMVEEKLPFSVTLAYLGAILAGGWFIAPKAVFAARKFTPDMNLLMTVAVIGAMAIGEWAEGAAVTFLFALALLLESWSADRARQAIKALMDLSPTMARFICPHDGCVEEKPVGDIPVGATILVRPGEKVPLDGTIIKGETAVNQAPITGESLPVAKRVGDEVFAGTINGDGAFEFRSTRPASDTTLARIIHMVEEAQARRAPSEQWVEKFSRLYTPAMMILALLIAILPPVLFSYSWTSWLYNGLVVLVIACPCALVISTPVSIVAGLTSAARNGVLIKGGAYLEAPARLQVLAFDKTGTLTYGNTQVQKVIPLNGHTEQELLGNAAAMETHSTHPLGRAIVQHAAAMGVEPPAAEGFVALPGQGARAVIRNRDYWIGSHRMLDQLQGEDPGLHGMATQLEDAGHSLVFMWCEDHVCGLISIADQLRPESHATVQELKELGIARVAMLTGDNRKTAHGMAQAAGIDECYAELLPEDKVQVVTELTRKFGRVAMVGDGVNDAPAMAAAQLGIAMGAMGSDAAIEIADIALMSDDISKLPWLVRHSRKTLRVIKQNMTVALGLKTLFIVLASVGMATLWVAIAADMGASLLVIFNGLRLLKTA
jgi:Cd2+/Zn2+-exporting ATPase